MLPHTRYVVHLVGTDKCLHQPRYYCECSFEKAALYLRKRDADNLAGRWNSRRADPRYVRNMVLPEAEVLAVSVALQVGEPDAKPGAA